MGVIFVDSRHEVLLDVGDDFGRLFISMTETVSKWYSHEPPISSEMLWSETYYVDGDKFCPLVEQVFANPIDLFYIWAQYAAAMYEIIKDYNYDWKWTEIQTPLIPDIIVRQQEKIVPLLPFYRGTNRPQTPSNKTMAPRHVFP